MQMADLPTPDLQGRIIRIVAPARWVEDDILGIFWAMAKFAGADAQKAPQCAERDHQLAGADKIRAAALNEAIEDDNVDIIWCARGGYGAGRLLGRIDFPAAKRPKLLVGYSDMTALHQRALGTNVRPVHAAMPFDLCKATGAENLKRAFHFCGEALSGAVPARDFDLGPVRAGAAEGVLIAGNLHVLAMLLGTRYEPIWPDCILCVEDVGEYYYAVDRLFWRLAQSRLAASIKGIALGAFTDMEDNETPWGASVEQIAALHFSAVPIATGMPIGHGPDNKPLLLGAQATLNVEKARAVLTT
jgi:muramoyltetrapeptide carboxypeptidase